MSRDQNTTNSRIDKLKKERAVYNRGEMWFTKWKSMPKDLMGKYQDSREDPVQVYRLLKNAIVDEPERVEHDRIVKLLKRYREALPETVELNPPRKYLDGRIRELQDMVNKDNYTKQELLRIAATCLSPEDAQEADLKMNKQNRELKEYAEGKIQSAVKLNLKKTTLKPEDQWIDNPFNRKRQYVHSCVTQNKPLPKAMIKNDFQVQRGRGRGGRGGRGRGGSQRFFGTNTTNFQDHGDTGRNRGYRGRGGGRGRGGNRGGRAPKAASADTVKENVDPSARESSTTKVNYDMSKIPEGLDHFGDVCEDIHRQLQDQLLSRGLEIE